MDSHASWRLPDLQNLVFRFAALLAWAVAIYFFPDTIENDTDEKWEAYMAISAGAATVVAVVSASLLSRIGVRASALLIFLAAFVFYGVFLFRHHSLPDGNLYGLYATPYFCVVMGVYLSLRWNVGPLKLLLFSLAVNFAHFFATDYAIRFYEGTGTIFGPYIDQYNLPLDDTYLLSGLIGGIIGSFLSFLTLTFVNPNFGRPLQLLFYVLVLGVIGSIGLGFSGEFDPKIRLPYLWLYPPWQITFGFMIVKMSED